MGRTGARWSPKTSPGGHSSTGRACLGWLEGSLLLGRGGLEHWRLLLLGWGAVGLLLLLLLLLPWRGAPGRTTVA